MSEERILVEGPALRTGVVGAYLAKNWLGAGRSLAIVPDTGAASSEPFLTRSNVQRFHAELGLPMEQVTKQCGGSLALSTSVQTTDGPAHLPFSPVGLARNGVDFHHFWRRARGVSDQPELMSFSLSLELERADRTPQLAQIAQLPIEFGLRLDRRAYSQTLLSFAKQNGAEVLADADGHSADLVVDCGDTDAGPIWRDGTLRIGPISDIPGMEWHVVSSAALRLSSLMAPLNDCAAEQREWTRLAEAERERILDMEELLVLSDPTTTERPALKRKLDVFAACGKIPTEDYEVFAPPEWLAAVWARGFRPRRYDRMADLLPEVDLIGWLSQLHSQITDLTKQPRAA